MLKHTLKVLIPLTTSLQIGSTQLRYVMKNIYFLMVLTSMAVFLTGCPKTVPIPETSFDDLEKVRSLTAEEEAENAKVLSDYDKKEEIIEEIKVTDIVEKKELVKEKEVVEEAKKVRLGDPMHGKTDMGPLASKMQLEKTEEKVERAKSEGARLLCGGNRPKEFEKGYFYNPTIFDRVTREMELMNMETFGPIIPIQKVKNLEEAIELANDSQYGLGCNIYTNDMENCLLYTSPSPRDRG